MEHLKNFGYLFYIANPYETSFEKLSDIPKPDYVGRAFPYFFGLIFMEQIILKLKGKEGIRLNDGFSSVANGIIMVLREMLMRGTMLSAYLYIYANWRIYELPWDSLMTWIVTAILVDFAYYWVHRAAHELNILWAAHQVHHSSEDYNMTTALRQSLMQGFGSMPFYLPLAFFIPPTQTIVHQQFNLIYQFWIHTEVVDNIGPLEYILNTASHHRVHHGSNRYCLDKNYAGVLIIWDRMFGTFAQERKDEKIVYGLVDQPQFFNPMQHQIFYYGKVLEKAGSMTTLTDKVKAFVYGPGWFPGTERLGDSNGVPEIQQRQKYDPKIPSWMNVYVVLHFLLVFLAFEDLGRFNLEMSFFSVLTITAYLMWTLTSLGMIFDKSSWAWPSELIRSALFFTMYVKFGAWNEFRIPSQILYASFAASMTISLIMIFAKIISSSAGGKKNIKTQ